MSFVTNSARVADDRGPFPPPSRRRERRRVSACMHGRQLPRVRWPGEPSNRPAQLRPGHKTAWIPTSPSWSSTTRGSRASKLLPERPRRDHTHDDCGSVQAAGISGTNPISASPRKRQSRADWLVHFSGKTGPPRAPLPSAAPGRRKNCAQRKSAQVPAYLLQAALVGSLLLLPARGA